MNIDNINEIYTFNDFISALKLLQSRQLNEYDTLILFDNIQKYVFAHFAVIFKNDNQSNINGNVLTSYGTNSNYDQDNFKDYSNEPLPLFIDFIKIFLNLHTTHKTNIALVSFISCIATYFVFYLLNNKEIWLAIMFLRLCEKYLLKPLHLRKTVNNDIDRSLLKDNLTFVIFNPSYIESKSLKCYNNITNTVLYSKLRLLLMIHALLEFRNSQASNINILYFILAKFTVFKLIRKKLLDDINFVLKIIIRNWKFLKGENAKVGSEEYILNGLTMKHTTEMLSMFQPSSQHNRNDISFMFFKDFYIGDEFGQFNDLTGKYCEGEEDTLINEYGFMNHVGIIQKWILFFVNFFYSDMFDDCKVYLLNHITHSKMKKELLSTMGNNNDKNIPDEEVNLGKLILFNVHLFVNVLQMYSLELIQILLPNCNEGSCSCCYAEMFNNTFVKFVSPVDVPFLIFEFFATVNGYVTTKNQMHKMKKDLLLQKNISNYLLEIVERYKKDFNMSVYDGLEFCDFLIMKGVDCDDGNSVTKEVNSDVTVGVVNAHSKIQKYIYVCFVWFITLTYKTCTFSLVVKYKELLISALMCMNGELRKKAFTFLFVVVNGYINYLNETVQHVDSSTSNCVNNNNNNNNSNTNLNTNTTFIKSQHETFLELLSFQNDLLNLIINDEHIMANIIKDYFDNYITNIGIIQTERILHLYYTTLNTILYNTNKTDLIENYTKHFHTPYYSTTTTTTNTTNIIHFRSTNIFDIFFTSTPDTSLIFALLCPHLSPYIHKPKLKSLLYVIFTVLRSHFSSYKSLDSIKSLIRDISLKKDKQHLISPSLDHLINLHFIKTTYVFVFLFIKYHLLQQRSQKGKDNIGNYLKWYSLYIIFISKNKDDFFKRVQTITTFITRDANLNDIEIKSNLRNIVKNICYGNIIYDYSNLDFINSISELLNYDQNITIEYTNITSNKKKALRNNAHITNHKLKVVYTLATNEIFKEMFNTMLMHVNETYECYLTSKCEEFGEVKEQRGMFNRMNVIVKEMMGIDKDVNLVLDVCYSYERNEALFNCVHGKPQGRKKLRCCDGDVCGVVMDERQRNELNGGVGNNNNDERRSSSSKNNIEKIYSLLQIKQKQKQKTHLNVVSSSNSHNNNVNKDIKYKLKLKRTINNNTNNNNCGGNTNTNTNVITEGSYYNATAISSFIRKITRIYFYRFLSAVFWTYKSHIDKTELETLELLNIKPKDNTYISCILKEKYISLKELDQNDDTTFLLNTDTDYLNTSFDHCFYPFDILKLNKIKQGKGTRSKLLRELKKKKNKKRIHTLIKNKVTELKAKIAYYEEQMQELGLRFVSSVELNNNNNN